MIHFATEKEIAFLLEHDRHISEDELKHSLRLKRVLISKDSQKPVGWLRYNLFWDNTPFMNLLYVLEEERGKGDGKALISFWEKEMRKMGYDRVLTSSQSDEQAQFFYRQNGYIDCGSLILPDEPLEIFFLKNI